MIPDVLVLTGYGINCEEETRYAFEYAGAHARVVHVNDLIENPSLLETAHILAFPGGFSYGDNLGSGNAFANKVRAKLWEPLERFVQEDEKLVIGICNGFQILANLGLVPAQGKKYGERQIGLMHNDNHRYTCRWVDVRACNDSPWLKNIKTLKVPVAHGEGKTFASKEVLEKLKQAGQVALKYFDGPISKSQGLPYNPNGALEDIAGITNETGRVLGLMPHPERALFFTQYPDWTLEKEYVIRAGKPLPVEGNGVQVFRNAVEFVQENV